ncbi:MAG: ribose 5-phosphate isomerase B [Peptostreptococcaceae bacterium]|nr:ribose 5-phosphate isomerase B [Peptostreptococcaceae bacterium]MDY5738433.1 ribose 5-phosphate isomerase B [Anaerovoracaceae bacterium]SFE55341.1 ribose 5-phosphate isomerase B [Peptostreptococcaceae bacterium pGA-8]
MIIALAADHGGVELKKYIREYLREEGYKLVDLGTNSDESVDYPIYGRLCAEAVAGGKAQLGIVFCGSGIGISIAANRVKGARCALCTSVEMAKLSKQHNNANMLSLGGRLTSPELAKEIVKAWLSEEFQGGRHQRRIDLLDE